MDMATAVAAALAAPMPPATTAGQVEALGGRTTGTRALALMRAGRDPEGPLPSSRTDPDGYRAYRTARRQVERWLNYETDSGRERRRPNAEILRGQRGRVRAIATRRRVALLRRRGARARIFATVRVSDDVRDRELPAGGPGQLLNRGDVETFTDPFLAGDFAAAGGLFEALFLLRYSRGDDLGFEITDVHRVTIWAQGTSEPR